MSRYALIRAALDVLSTTRAANLLPSYDAAGFVITLHHVRPAAATQFQPNALLSITPDFLDRLLAHLKVRGWRFVSVDELMASAGDRRHPRRIAVTLDDGYRNNLQHALPVFRRYAVPFTIYVCPGFCDRTAELWWEALERIIAAASSVPAPGEEAATLATADLAGKTYAFERWTAWLTTSVDELEQRVVIRKLAAEHDLDLAALARDLVMDWDEVRTIAAEPLCTIGAHTMTHAALARLPQQAAFEEIAASVERISKEIGKRPTSIAFPYGYPSAAGPREAALAAEAGLASSFTTQPGYIPAEGPRHGLPRVSVNGLFQKLRYLDVLLTPGLWKVRERLFKRA